MRKLLWITLLLALSVSSAEARRPKEKAGEVVDSVYVDGKYNFSFTIGNSWKCKVEDAKSNFRLFMTQINYEIPSDYVNSPDYTKIPKITVWADTTTLGTGPFIDSLLSETYKSDLKKDVLKEFDILNNAADGAGMKREKVITKGRKSMDIAGERGFLWTGQVSYRNDVASSASTTDGMRVYGGYGGAIIGVKKGNLLILFHVICERDYFETILGDALKMVNSLKWTE